MSAIPDMSARVEAVRRRIAEACRRAGRQVPEVTLVAVSKNRSPEQIAGLAAAGIGIFGESRVREACQKAELCPTGLTWHFIGHLQSNKVKPAVSLFDMIHSVDSLPLLNALDRAAGEQGRRPAICLQVNVSGEGSKFGVAPADLPRLAAAAAECRNLQWIGLMTIPPAVRDPEDARPYFRRLRELGRSCYDAAGAGEPGLSMGMSHDFEIAIEEGARWVRVGSALFEGSAP